ncbi:MAG: penicillin-binding protein 1C [Elusimicrobia bacterium]|nr:penicillin-binding protein 1C [Elusimicrobiota bacterium]
MPVHAARGSRGGPLPSVVVLIALAAVRGAFAGTWTGPPPSPASGEQPAPATAWPPRARPPTLAEVREGFCSSEVLLLDRRGRTIQEVRSDPVGRRLEWTPLARVSPAVARAVLAAEDRRFYSHGGVDWLSLAAALWQTAGGRPRGASTITMQLAGFLDRDLLPRHRRRSSGQKLRQIRRARELERRWTKEEILEAYLNLIAGRGELQGIGALSQWLYAKEPHGIAAAEASVLAALLREPAAPMERALRRGRAIAKASGWDVPEDDLRQAVGKAFLGPRRIRPAADLAPLAARRLMAESLARGGQAVSGERRTACASDDLPSRGQAIASTIDGRLQAAATDILRGRLAGLEGRNVSDGAVLVVDNASGDVLAYVGNGGPASSARHVDGITARRQAGSTLKPFLYALALDRRVLTAASTLDDSPLGVVAGRGLFQPENYDKRFRGPVTVRQALAGSINIPAVRALDLVGEDRFVAALGRLGFEGLEQADFYGPSLALGSPDISLWELVAAYRALANGGQYAPLRLAPGGQVVGKGAVRRRRVFSAEAAYLAADILSDRGSRSAAFGLESALDTRFWTAVKTGTSKDMRDNWCVGFSGRYTVGVWVGNFSGQPMWNVSGVSGAAPVWHDVMGLLHEGVPSPRPAAPEGLVRRGVVPAGSAEPRSEWFLRGTEPDTPAAEFARERSRILYPVAGEILALDPDIPEGRQELRFEAASGEGLFWTLDGRVLGPADRAFDWSPDPGSHRLELSDAAGKTVGESRFVVRGQRTHVP